MASQMVIEEVEDAEFSDFLTWATAKQKSGTVTFELFIALPPFPPL